MSRFLISLVALLVVTSIPAAAQPLGTFTWQLQPYCNVLTLAVTQNGTTFTLDGVDDLCGAGPASAVGTAFFKTDGTVGMGLHLVTTPGAAPVHLTVVLNPATLGGAWTDSGGNSGTLLFNPTAPVTGAPRPVGGGLASVAVTNVIAGAGLTGGGMGPVNLAVAYGGTGSAETAARSDHTHGKGAFGTAVGDGALQAQTTGTSNTAVGYQALLTNTVGERNTALGTQALRLTTGMTSDNTAVGYQAMAVNTFGRENAALGDRVLVQNTTGMSNSALGHSALANNTTGDSNVAVGKQALASTVNSNLNTAVGSLALLQATAGNNTAVGGAAGLNITTGSSNTIIGYAAGWNITTGSNNILVGHLGGGYFGGGAESATIRIGTAGTQTRAFIAGIRGVTTADAAVPVLVDTDGQLGTISSSRRFKQDIAGLGDVGLKLHQLRPVQFRYMSASTDAPGPLEYGLIAEEVDEVLPELVVRSADGAIETVQYHVLPSLLVAEVQRLERERQRLERERKVLTERLDALEALVNTLTKR